jgi:ABC-type amino acid transport substrate-binding protein
MNIIIPNGDTALADEMNKIIKQLEEEGFIKQLAIKYIGGIE